MKVVCFVMVVTFIAHRTGSNDSRRDGGGSQQDEIDHDLVRPLFRPSPQNVTVSPGERAALKCRVDQLGTKTVIWRKVNDSSPLTIGNFPFAADARISVDFNMRSSEWTLMIQDIRTSDEGLYICQVSSKDTNEHMFVVQLNVKTIQVSGSNVVESGTPIKLFCNATGRPEPPHNVEWIKDGQIVHSDAHRDLIVTKKIETKMLTSILSIRSSRLQDAGEYICLSSDMESAAITVIVVVPTVVGKRGATGHLQAAFGTYSISSPHRLFTSSTTTVFIAVAVVLTSFRNIRVNYC